MVVAPGERGRSVIGATVARALALACLLAGAFTLLPVQTARGQQRAHSNYLVGDRSLGLGGAFVGVADDPSANFHNPGGIASLPTSSISGSLWAVSFLSRSVEPGYETVLGSTQLDHSEAASLPLFLAGVAKVGKLQRDEVRPHALGVAILTPHDRSFTSLLQLNSPGGDAVRRLEVRREERSRWFGLSYAYRLTERFSLGTSLFLEQRVFSHSEV